MEQPNATCRVKLVSGGLRHSGKCCSGDGEWNFLCPEPPTLHCWPVAELKERTESCRVCTLLLNSVNWLLTLHWWKLKCRFLVKVASDFKMKLFRFDFWCFQITSPTPKQTHHCLWGAVSHGKDPALPPLEDTLAFNIWILPYIIPTSVKQVLFGGRREACPKPTQNTQGVFWKVDSHLKLKPFIKDNFTTY